MTLQKFSPEGTLVASGGEKMRRKVSKALAAAGYILGRHEANVPLASSKTRREWIRLEKPSGFWR